MTPDVPSVRKLMARQDLTREESAALLGSLLRTDEEGWRFLAFSVASQTKGETLDELLGMLDALRDTTGPYDLELPEALMDLSSSGGSGIRKINVSTLSALVVGDPEAPVAKTSFWGITSVTGSADVLRGVGIEVPALTEEQLGQALRTVGVAFYSPLFLNRELRHLVNFGRTLGTKSIGVNTPFNLIGPLFTPLALRHRMFGVNNPEQLGRVIDICRGLGYAGALALHSLDGLDEAAIYGPTRLVGYRGGEAVDLVLEPEQVGLETAPREAVQPRDAGSNLRDFVRIARGRETGPKRDMVALNSGIAFWLSGRAASIAEGVELAVRRLESGAVGEKLAALVEAVGRPDVLRRVEQESLSP